MPVRTSFNLLSPHYFWFPRSFPVCCRTFKHLGSRHWCWCTAQQMVRENKLWQNENTVSAMDRCWSQRSMQSWKVMRQMSFNQKIKGKVGYLNGCWDFQQKTFAREARILNLLRYFHPARIWLSFLFSWLRFRLNLADMFCFFIPSQHPLSAYCWARQEPCESWSKLLNAGVYRSDNAKADSLFCIGESKPSIRSDYDVQALLLGCQIYLLGQDNDNHIRKVNLMCFSFFKVTIDFRETWM